MYRDLENIYEDMLSPSILRVVRQPIPLSPVTIIKSTKKEMEEDGEEEISEKEEVDVAREILSCVSELDDIAKEAMYKSFRNKIEKQSDKIRKLANKIIEGHGKNI